MKNSGKVLETEQLKEFLKEYLAKPDYDWLEDTVNDLVDQIAALNS